MRHVLFLILSIPGFIFGGVGSQISNFGLSGTDGKVYQLETALKTTPLVAVVFVATKCPYSNAYNERYNQLVQELKKRKKVTLFAINSNDTEPMDEVKGHAQEKQFSFPVLKDEKHQVADLFGAEKTPEVFLVNQERKVVYHGRIDNDSEGKNVTRNDLLEAIDEVLSKKRVSIAETKAFGCSIKRK